MRLCGCAAAATRSLQAVVACARTFITYYRAGSSGSKTLQLRNFGDRPTAALALDDVDGIGIDPIATVPTMFALRNASLVARKLPARR